MTLSELSQYCHVENTEAVKSELDRLEARGILEIRRFQYGQFCVRLKIRDWESLPDYDRGIAAI
jgi:hypothetical protein